MQHTVTLTLPTKADCKTVRLPAGVVEDKYCGLIHSRILQVGYEFGKEEKRKMSNCKTIAICNQKGGVGKTTTAVNLGVGLAMQGKRYSLSMLIRREI